MYFFDLDDYFFAFTKLVFEVFKVEDCVMKNIINVSNTNS